VKEKNVSSRKDIIEKVRAAGVVGAGGAGFPTHVKLSASADTVIANGAECEPLICSDRQLLLREPEKVITGLEAAMTAVGAKRGVIAVKSKHKELIGTLGSLISNKKELELFLLEDFYPAGDEHVLVYEVTRRVVPMGGIPINKGVLVDNVYTLKAVSDALEGKSFTHRYVTVTGEVNEPKVAFVPIGMTIKETIDIVGGGIRGSGNKVIIGGPMMGVIEEDLQKPVLKTTNAVLVLPENCRTVELKSTSLGAVVKRSRSACCQCSYCTDMCPRFLLGNDLNPHKIMRVLPYIQGELNTDLVYSAALCSECNLCGYYTCSMGLSPNSINVMLKNLVKTDLGKMKMSEVNEYRDDRKVPVKRLMGRMGLQRYESSLEFDEKEIRPERITLPLKQHIGESCVPVVEKNDKIKAGAVVARITEGRLGADLHTPFAGTILDTKEQIVIDCR
jgi:Na+-translocating ferredoxin:NAD+ oxidoreductase RnfC subunit